MSRTPIVSVIIPTRNSKRTIQATLKSVRSQTHPKVEIIVVDQHSTDGTVEIAKRLADKLLSAKADKFYSAPPVSRNIGAKASKGKYLFHIDSDMQLHPQIIAECVDLLERNPQIKAIKVHEKDKGSGFWSRAKMLERKCYVGFDLIEAARFIRRTTFFELGGYDESLRSAEDWDMSKRIENVGEIASAKHFTTHNLGHMSYWYQVQKKFNYGLTLESILKKHRLTKQQEFAMIFRSAYLNNYKLFLKEPLAALGFLILRSSELIAYISGIIWARIHKIKV